MKSRILLVSPKFDAEYTRATGGQGQNRKHKRKSLMVPLHLATVAALTPDDFEVDIYDESVLDEIHSDTDFAKDYDLVGVTGYIAHLPRAKELAGIFRGRGLPVVMGGPGVSGSPDLCRGLFDVLLLGEVELIWPRFLREWKKGSHLREYRQVDRPDLSQSPSPRWDTVARYLDRYAMGGVQTTRGCPFDWEFCDVIHLYGRKPRHKPIDRGQPAVADRISFEKGFVLRIRKFDKCAIGQQAGRSAVRLGLDKGLDPRAGEQDRRVNRGKKLGSADPGDQTKSLVEPPVSRLIDAQMSAR